MNRRVKAVPDITEGKRAEQLLRESRDQLRLISDAVPVLISYVDAAERYQFCNRAYTQWLGVSGDQTIGRKMEEVVGAAAWQVIGPRVKKALAGEVVEYEAHAQYPAGARWIYAIYTPHRDAQGRVAGIVVMVNDITEHKRQQQALREGEQRYRSLFESIDEGFCVIEMIFDENQKPVDYLFLEVNPAFERQAGMHGATGKRMLEFVSDIEPHWLENYGRVALTGQPIRFADEYKSLNSWFDVYAFRLGGPQSRKVAVIFNNITERKLAEAAVLRSRAELAAANEQLASRATQLDNLVEQRTAELREIIGELEAFSYSMAHDLRGPLRALQGFANILRQDHGAQLDPAGRGYVARIGAAAERMHRLVSDVLTYSRVSRQALRLDAVPLQPLVLDIIEQYPPLKEAHIHIAGQLPSVLGNQGALTQVISNLLTNAVKFVPPGRAPQIEMSATANEQWVTLSIRDNGLGIAPEYHERIFRMFERIHSSEKYEGTGIGLAIVRRAVGRMGGVVGVESAEGQGSRFWVKLPRAGVPSQP